MKNKILTLLFIMISSLSNIFAQTFDWAKMKKGASGYLVASDPMGCSYIYGHMYAPSAFGKDTLDPVDGEHFIAKYDAEGKFQWVRQMDSINIHSMNAYGNRLYMSGNYYKGANIGNKQIIDATGRDGIIIRMDYAGNVTLVRTIRGLQNREQFTSIQADNSGNIYATGNFGPQAKINGMTINGAGSSNMIIVKYNPAGDIIWHKIIQPSQSNTVEAYNMALDRINNRIYITGEAHSNDPVSFDLHQLQPNVYGAEFIVKYNTSGAALDLVGVYNGDRETLRHIKLDANGNIYVTENNYVASYTVRKYNPSLDMIWEQTAPSNTEGVTVDGLEVTTKGLVLVAGTYFDDANFHNEDTLLSPGNTHSFISFYDLDGNYLRVKEFKGQGDNMIADIVESKDDHLNMTGSFNGNLKLDEQLEMNSTLSAMMIGKMNLRPNTPIARTTINITDSSAQARWKHAEGAEYYRVRFRPLGESAWSNVYQTRNNMLKLENLDPATQYEWSVRAVLIPSYSSAFSAAEIFTTDGADCGEPTNTRHQVFNTQVLLEWSAPENITPVNYKIVFKRKDDPWPSAPTYTVTDTFHNIYGLDWSTTFTWYVKSSCNENGSPSSDWVFGGSFTTDSWKTTGITSIDSRFEIYPNPVADRAVIKGHPDNNLTINLYDLTGKMVRSVSTTSIDGVHSFDCSQLPDGLYLVTINGSTHMSTQRITVKR